MVARLPTSLSDTVLDLMPVGVLVTDAELRIVHVNRWITERLGTDRAALVQRPLAAAFPELVERGMLGAYHLACQSRAPLTLPASVHRYLLAMPAPAGSELAHMAQTATIAPQMDGDRVAAVLTFIADVSQGEATELQLQRELARMSALHEIDQALATLDLPACLNIIVERTRTLFGGLEAAVLLRDSEGLHVVAEIGYGARALGYRLANFEGVTGWVAQHGRPVRVPDVSQSPIYVKISDATRSEMAAPLMLRRECIGVINVESPALNAFAEDDLEVLETLAGRAAAAIHNARLHLAEREQRELASTLRDIGLRLSAELDPEAILDTLLEHVQRVVPYDSASVLGFDSRAQRLRVERHRGYERFGVADLMGAAEFALDDAKHVRVMAETGRPHVVPATRQDPDWVDMPAARHVASWAGAPIVARGRVLGFLMLDKAEPGFYNAALADRLAAFAAQAGLALENARLYAEQQRLAITDGLTGLANRRWFEHVLERELARAMRFHHSTALIIFDLDDFKLYNDHFGHPAGDTVLREIARLTAANVRSVDVAARYGGEEFVIVLPEAELAAAVTVAERVRRAVAAQPWPAPDNGSPSAITVSLGVAAAPAHAQTPAGLVEAADTALYQAKSRGRNQIAVFEGEAPPAHAS